MRKGYYTLELLCDKKSSEECWSLHLSGPDDLGSLYKTYFPRIYRIYTDFTDEKYRTSASAKHKARSLGWSFGTVKDYAICPACKKEN